LSGEAQKLGVAIFQHQLEHFQPLESLTSAVIPRDHERGFRGGPILLRFEEFISSHARSSGTLLRPVLFFLATSIFSYPVFILHRLSDFYGV